MYQPIKNRDYGVNLCQGCLEKQREIDRLREENRQLKAKLRYRERQQSEGPFGSSTPSSKKALKPNSSKDKSANRGGAKLGHIGHGRSSLAQQDAHKVVVVSAPDSCPQCGGQLEEKGSRDRTVVDSPQLKVEKILYRLQRRYCRACRKSFQATAPGLLPKSLLGNQLISDILCSHYLHGQPLGRIAEQLQINLGTIIDLLHRTATLFKLALPHLFDEYRESKVRHADETSWRTDGQSSYAWIFCTERLSIFLFRQTRSSKVAKEVLGHKELSGYLVVDRYGGYNCAPCKLQYCYAHLLREVKDLAKEFPDDGEVVEFTSQLIPLLAEAQHLRGKPITNRKYLSQARQLRRRIIEVVHSPANHLGVRRIQDIFTENEARLYHWAEQRDVPADNNRAERELRPTVIARKVSFGSQSETGARTREILMSVMQTLKKRVADAGSKVKQVLDQLAVDPSKNVVKLLFGEETS